MPPIRCDFAIQLVMAKPKYNAPMTCMAIAELAGHPKNLAVSCGRKVSTIPVMPMISADDTINNFVFIVGYDFGQVKPGFRKT